ncbi:protein NRT1/ PTR FAMILY 6.4 [Cornus florida]|uniref:protein NRT1/ PTR FAMILY 6.4 n=1 Tax=Cornus florida TaxID=4283 RepID=UPI0028A17106|nr:protein NRT1/ PTR FAMILY 6.4 [Cornus florida]
MPFSIILSHCRSILTPPPSLSLSISLSTMVLVDDTHVDKGGENDGNVVDYRGNPADKSRTGGWLAAGLILGTELSERICVMGISMNLVTYLVGDLHISSSKSANIVTNFMGTLNLLGLLGGFLADAKLGRYLTVAISAAITASGVTLLTLATTISSLKPPPCRDSSKEACVQANGRLLGLLYAALYTIALGGGGIKSNVSGFGSDQFETTNPKEQKAMVYFFNRFYFCISLGSLFSVTVLVYIQDNVGRGWGYGLSAATMIIAVSILICGTRLYRFRKPRGSPLTVIWRVLLLAWRKRNQTYPSHPSLLNEYHNAKVSHTQRYRCLDKAAILDDDRADNSGKKNDPWMVSTVTEVEEVKMVIKLIPIWSTCILFWTSYSQMTTFTIEQATFMNRHIGSFVVPSGSLSFFLFITILLFTSLNERLFVPFARKITHNAQGLTSLQRIGIGLIFAIIGMAASAIVEKQRRDTAVQQNIISAFWLVPQFFLVGAGEAFAYVGQLEFFIREAPERMKSMSTGFFLTTLSMGYFVSSLLVTLVDKVTNKSWLKSNLNYGRLDNFYWMLAVLEVLNFSVFLFFSMRHQYKVQRCDDKEKELESWTDKPIEDMDKKGTADLKEGP